MAELREIYTEWEKSQDGKAMTWAELNEAYRTGQLKAVRVPDSLALAIEEASRGNEFMRSIIWDAVRVSYGLWFHQLPEFYGEMQRSNKESVGPLPEWETSQGFRAIMRMATH